MTQLHKGDNIANCLMNIREGVSSAPLSAKIRHALTRDPIVLGPESIDSYFRNLSEVDDVTAVLEAAREGETLVAAGIVGSRLEGTFYYSPRDLFHRLRAIDPERLELRPHEEVAFGLRNELPYRLEIPVINLASHLIGQQKLVDDLGRIDLRDLSPKVRELLRRVEHPADLYPDVDIFILANSASGEGANRGMIVRDRQIVQKAVCVSMPINYMLTNLIVQKNMKTLWYDGCLVNSARSTAVHKAQQFMVYNYL